MISVVQLQKTCTCENKSTYVPFYQLFTPSVIQSRAEFTSTYSYSTTALTFGKDGDRRSRDRQLFKLPLIPATVLDRHADITVVITMVYKIQYIMMLTVIQKCFYLMET